MRLGLGDLADRASMAMLVPLTFHGRGIGVLVALDRFDSAAPFSAEDERLMRAFAGSAATALATAQTVEEEQLRMSIASADQERGRWARELHDETLQGLGALQVLLTDRPQARWLRAAQKRSRAGGRAARDTDRRAAGADHRAATGGTRRHRAGAGA